jgi:hypothetical protein
LIYPLPLMLARDRAGFERYDAKEAGRGLEPGPMVRP